MKAHACCFTLVSTIAIVIAASLPAQAQRARVFVSVNGSDSNPCTAVQPCRTFQVAHDAVLAGGEISVLDTGGYGTIMINKAISIVSIGVEASIATVSGVDAITINANSSTDKVSLRGLTLDGQSVGGNGIRFNSGLSLTVSDCSIRNFSMDGLLFGNASTPQTLTVSNSSFNDNTNNGLAIESFSSGNVTASIDRSTFSGNHVAGLVVVGQFGTGALTVGVSDSVAANNGSQGYFVESASNQSISNLSLTHSMAEGNGTGVQASGTNATIWLAQSTLTGNAVSFDAAGGAIMTYGDNYLQAANGSPNGGLTSTTKQ